MLSAVPGSSNQSRLDTFAGGVAGFNDLATAAHDAALHADNTDGWYRSLDSAYDRRIEAVRLATGRTIANPLREAEAEDRARMIAPGPNIYSGPLEPEGEVYTADNPPPSVRRARERFEAELRTIAEQYPDRAEALGIGRAIEQDALDVAKQSGETLDRFAQSASGLMKWPALLYGGATGMMRDPIQVTTMLIGAGPGAGRTVAARILNVAMKEAAINGVVEAALQPGVQAWREKAGLPAGLEEAMTNVAFAAGLGGAFGATLQGGGELIGRALRGPDLERAAAGLASNPDVSERARAALAGDTAAARAELEQIRTALPAEARGALDHAEDLAAIEAVRPRAVDPEVHDQAVARALEAAQMERPATMPLNRAQAERIAEQLAPMIETAAKPPKTKGGAQPRSLTDFLIRAGGVIDQNGEVMAVTGGDRVARRGLGTLVRENGLDLDSARLRAAEAGYMDRQFGTPEDAMARSTVADLLSLMDEDLRGNRVLARNDVAAVDAIAEIEITRDRIARDVSEFQRLAGPGLDDATVVRALEIARDEGIDLAEAAERAVMELPEPGAASRAGDIPPGWSDEELMAASGTRAPDFDGGGIDDPGNPPDWTMDRALDDGIGDDELIPMDNGDLMSKRELLDELDRADDEIMLVEACRA